MPLAALTELYRATGDASLLTKARTHGERVDDDTALNPGGILHDPGEQPAAAAPTARRSRASTSGTWRR